MQAGKVNSEMTPQSKAPSVTDQPIPSVKIIDQQQDAETHAKPEIIPEEKGFSSPEEFVRKLWPLAKFTASFIGGDPEILLAQAALETHWGKNILPSDKGNSSHNLFNIKADNSWAHKTATVASLEQKNGVLVKEKSLFRSYSSYYDSFLDYANFLKQNNRYADALNKALNPEQFVHALQNAGYATDGDYADKILKIFSSPTFKHLIAKVKQAA
jgi:flagellar protein FlgJ